MLFGPGYFQHYYLIDLCQAHLHPTRLVHLPHFQSPRLLLTAVGLPKTLMWRRASYKNVKYYKVTFLEQLNHLHVFFYKKPSLGPSTKSFLIFHHFSVLKVS